MRSVLTPHLPAVAEGVEHGEVGGILHVGIIEDDHGVLAAEFQNDAFQSASGGLKDVLSGGAAADEGDQVHIGLHEGLALGFVAMNDLKHAFGQELVVEIREGLADQRRFLRRFHDHGVSGHEGWESRSAGA